MSQPSLARLLNVYRDAVEVRTFWQDHGTHGDGNLSQALHAEKLARQALEAHFAA